MADCEKFHGVEDVVACECGWKSPRTVGRWTPAAKKYDSSAVRCGSCGKTSALCCGGWSPDGEEVLDARCRDCCHGKRDAQLRAKGWERVTRTLYRGSAAGVTR